MKPANQKGKVALVIVLGSVVIVFFCVFYLKDNRESKAKVTYSASHVNEEGDTTGARSGTFGTSANPQEN